MGYAGPSHTPPGLDHRPRYGGVRPRAGAVACGLGARGRRLGERCGHRGRRCERCHAIEGRDRGDGRRFAASRRRDGCGSVASTEDAATLTASLSLLAADTNHARGTFPGAERWFLAAGALDATSLRALRLGAAPLDPPLAGKDATSGAPATLGGNYGVLYRVEVQLGVAAGLAAFARGGGLGGRGHPSVGNRRDDEPRRSPIGHECPTGGQSGRAAGSLRGGDRVRRSASHRGRVEPAHRPRSDALALTTSDGGHRSGAGGRAHRLTYSMTGSRDLATWSRFEMRS